MPRPCSRSRSRATFAVAPCPVGTTARLPGGRAGAYADPMDMPPLPLLAACIAVTFAAGIVKGAVGFAMPLIMVSGIGMLLDPQTTVAAVILPIVATNLVQTFRTGVAPAVEAAREHWAYLAIVCAAILAFAQLLPRVDARAFSLILGVPVTILSAIQLAGWQPRIPPGRERAAEVGAGLVSGALGGLAGTWGPTTVLYLLALGVPKAKSVIVQGVIYGTGSIALLVAHLVSGVLNPRTAPLSALLLIPGLVGIWIGLQVQDRLDAARFRRWTLVVLAVAGLNLVRKGLTG